MDTNVKPEVKRVERPWGGFAQYASNGKCTVSLMTVLPGERLSLQSHSGRDELWIVIDEGALIQVGKVAATYYPGEEIWIPAGSMHRLSNPGERPVRVLEVAFGDWRQDDIVRYDDDYKR